MSANINATNKASTRKFLRVPLKARQASALFKNSSERGYDLTMALVWKLSQKVNISSFRIIIQICFLDIPFNDVEETDKAILFLEAFHLVTQLKALKTDSARFYYKNSLHWLKGRVSFSYVLTCCKICYLNRSYDWSNYKES